MSSQDFARRPRILGGLTPHEDICNIRASKRDSVILNPIHKMPGPNSQLSVPASNSMGPDIDF